MLLMLCAMCSYAQSIRILCTCNFVRFMHMPFYLSPRCISLLNAMPYTEGRDIDGLYTSAQGSFVL